MVLIAFATHLLARPERTPILTLTSSYGPNWDLNAWVEEDLGHIQSLGARSFQVQSLSSIDRLAAGFWDKADTRIDDAFSAPGASAVVFYINLHGAVDDQGQPCWIPPNATADDASTWFPVRLLLDRIAATQSARHNKPALLLLECGKLRSQWSAGIAENDFDNRLRLLVQDHHQRHPDSRVVVMSSCASRQRSLHSQLGQGDIFTSFLAQGLTGAADGFEHSQHDGWVDSEELFQFVRHHTERWSIKHRGKLQSPTLYATGATRHVLLGQVDPDATGLPTKRTAAPSPASIERFDAAMAKADEIRDTFPLENAMHQWAQIQRTLHALGQSTYGGIAARRSSERWYNRLDRQLTQLQQMQHSHQQASAGCPDLQSLRAASTIWNAIAKRPSLETVRGAIDSIAKDQLTPVPALHLMAANDHSLFWQDASSIQSVANTRARWLETLREQPDSLFPAANHLAQPAETQWRILADTVIADIRNGEVSKADINAIVRKYAATVDAQTNVMNDLATASRIRDLSFVELPPLCQWLDEVGVDADSKEAQRIVRAIGDTVRLDRRLSSLASCKQTWNETWHEETIAISQSIEKSVASLTQKHDAALRELEATASGHLGATAGRLAGAIRCPRLPSAPQERTRASHQLRKLDQDLSTKPNVTAATNASAAADESQNRLTTSVPLGSRCLAKLLEIDETQVSGRLVRTRLHQLASPEIEVHLASQQWRRVVAITLDGSFSETVAQSQNRMRRFRLADRAEVALEGFWRTDRDADKPHFAVAATRLLDAADAILPDSNQWTSRKRNIEKQLNEHVKGADHGLSLSASSDPSYSDGGVKAAKISIELAANSGRVPVGLGIATVTQHNTTDGRSLAVSDKDDAPRKSHIAMKSWNGDPAEAAFRFRGHTYWAPVTITDTSRGVSANNRAAPRSAKVTLVDGVARGRAVTFVFDCSASMNDPVNPEIARHATGLGATKLDAARSAMIEMLRQLTLDNTDVGVVLYGHRMALGKDKELILQNRYHKQFPFPPTLQPFEDVEVALPTGRFAAEQFSQARQHLAATAPWGQTPLLLAITTAINDVTRLGDGVIKDVVVVSDGKNYQFNPRPDADVSLDSVVNLANANHVRVHVIGFGLDKNDREAIEQFDAIARGTGGQACVDATEANHLLGQLQQIASAHAYQVETNTSRSTAAIGKTITVSGIEQENELVNISIGTQSIIAPVSPGSHIRLHTDPAGGMPIAERYLSGWSADSMLVHPSETPSMRRLAIHHPKLIGNNLSLQLSLQRTDHRVARRPELIWLEVTPQKNAHSWVNDATSVYRTGSVAWLDETVCPVGQFECRRWPEEALQYEVKAWTCDQRPTGMTIELETRNDQYKPLASLAGIEYRIEPIQDGFQLRLRYAASATPDSMLIVKAGNDDHCDETHWYDAKRHTSVHTFFRRKLSHTQEPTRDQTATQDRVTFWVCPVSEMKQSAMRTEKNQPIVGSIHAEVAEVSATR